MPHMDMDTEMESGVSYADHEIINLAINSDGGGKADEFVSVDPLAEELDRSQVAELVYYERSLKLAAGTLEYGIGFNVSDDDFLEQAVGNNPTDFSTGNFAGHIYDEPGILDFVEIGNSNDLDAENERRTVDFRDRYGSGPFVDATDDLDIHLEYSTNSGSDVSSSSVQVQFAYRIHEAPEGVPRFANPLHR